jgi:hypothetical protein
LFSSKRAFADRGGGTFLEASAISIASCSGNSIRLSPRYSRLRLGHGYLLY